MWIRTARWPCLAILAVAAALPAGHAEAQTAQDPDREALQQQLNAQKAKNEELRQRIARLEEILKTDVCSNDQAKELLKTEQQPAFR